MLKPCFKPIQVFPSGDIVDNSCFKLVLIQIDPRAVLVGPSRKLHQCWTVDTPAVYVWPPFHQNGMIDDGLLLKVSRSVPAVPDEWLIQYVELCDMVNGCRWDELSMYPDHSMKRPWTAEICWAWGRDNWYCRGFPSTSSWRTSNVHGTMSIAGYISVHGSYGLSLAWVAWDVNWIS